MSATPTHAEIDAAVRRVLAGDRDAFVVVVDGCQDAVWRVVATILEDRAATEELVHRAFIRAYERLESYAIGSDPIAWLATIARNLARNHLRDRQRERQRLHLYQESVLATSEHAATWQAEDARLRQSLAECRESLAADAQEALRLFYSDDLPIAAVATRLGRSDAATQKLLSRVRIALRDCVARKQAAS